MAVHVLKLADKWYYEVSSAKTIEGRLGKDKFLKIKVGDEICFIRAYTPEIYVSTYVTAVRAYPSFEEMLKAEGLEKVLPGVDSVEEGIKVYRQFYTEEDEKTYGVLAFEFQCTGGGTRHATLEEMKDAIEALEARNEERKKALKSATPKKASAYRQTITQNKEAIDVYTRAVESSVDPVYVITPAMLNEFQQEEKAAARQALFW